MKFNAKPVDCNGMSLSCYVDGISMSSVLKEFPEGRMIGYYDEEKGYDDDEVGFVSSTGEEFYVYARFGHVRVGSRNGFNDPTAEELAKFLKEMIRSK